ncbi:MAG: radical SAM protein [Desulfobacterales bacterium]|nr:radical SAM protein [Desulfobacterales bacterium]
MPLTIENLIAQAREGRGLSSDEAAFFIDHASCDQWQGAFRIAKLLTASRFQQRLHFFAPLYFSSFCVNDCTYCGFQAGNRLLKRKVLTEDEFLQEARFLWNEGHRTLLLIAGEHPLYSGVGQIASYVAALRRAGLDFSLIVEVGPLSLEDYGILHELGINHCLLFQETYHRETYTQVHRGRKRDFDWRLRAMERALSAGIEKVGVGILLGLGSWQFDLIRLIDYAYKIKEEFGSFPATFSFPRMRPANGTALFQNNAVSDGDFQKILAISRLTCPTVGLVLTTRESPDFRRKLLERGLGITHISAGSSTTPGGYTLKSKSGDDGQFELADHRPLLKVVNEVLKLGYQPVMSSSLQRELRV